MFNKGLLFDNTTLLECRVASRHLSMERAASHLTVLRAPSGESSAVKIE